MTSLLGRIFNARSTDDRIEETAGDRAYAEAMSSSGELIHQMQAEAQSTDAARAVMADLFLQRHNVPFVTAVVETVEEMTAGIKQKPTDL